MQLPFTTEQFFDLLAAYDEALWPVLAVLWMASLIASLLLFSSRGPSDRWISGLLTNSLKVQPHLDSAVEFGES
jgi:hypothetical protein